MARGLGARGHEGFLNRLDPRAKIAAVTLISATVFFTVRIEAVSVLLAFIVVVWIAGGLPAGDLLRYFRLIRGPGLFLIITQALWRPGSTVILSPVIPRWVPLVGGYGVVTAEGLYWGVLSTGRLLSLVLALPILTDTTPAGLLALGLVKMGLPYTTSFLATAALNLVPRLQYEAESIMEAQLLRGAKPFSRRGVIERVKAYASIALPLGVSSMRKAHLMGVAMDSRAFGSDTKRTFIREIEMKKRDWAFIGSCVSIGALSAILSMRGF